MAAAESRPPSASYYLQDHPPSSALEIEMRAHSKSLTIAAITFAGAGALASCSSGSATTDGADPSVTITSPTENSKVASSVDVAWKTNVQLGDPDTGLDHVHVFVDGASTDYTVVGGDNFTVTGLTPGKHTIDVTLQHADHTSAGASDAVDVMVSGKAGGGASPSPSQSPTPSPSDTGSTGRYDY